LVWCISLFGEGDGAAVATCAALPWRCPWFLLLGTRIRFFQVMYLWLFWKCDSRGGGICPVLV